MLIDVAENIFLVLSLLFTIHINFKGKLNAIIYLKCPPIANSRYRNNNKKKKGTRILISKMIVRTYSLVVDVTCILNSKHGVYLIRVYDHLYLINFILL